MTAPPLALRAYRLAAAAFAPAAPLVLRARARQGKEEIGRLSERFGRANLPPPRDNSSGFTVLALANACPRFLLFTLCLKSRTGRCW
jgi:hypothetical protein